MWGEYSPSYPEQRKESHYTQVIYTLKGGGMGLIVLLTWTAYSPAATSLPLLKMTSTASLTAAGARGSSCMVKGGPWPSPHRSRSPRCARATSRGAAFSGTFTCRGSDRKGGLSFTSVTFTWDYLGKRREDNVCKSVFEWECLCAHLCCVCDVEKRKWKTNIHDKLLL